MMIHFMHWDPPSSFLGALPLFLPLHLAHLNRKALSLSHCNSFLKEDPRPQRLCTDAERKRTRNDPEPGEPRRRRGHYGGDGDDGGGEAGTTPR